ncbi:hypothetical protein Tco_1419876 [Tanacetum coccineum]
MPCLHRWIKDVITRIASMAFLVSEPCASFGLLLVTFDLKRICDFSHIICHEKVVRIPLEGDETLRVHGERTQGVVKTLMNTKASVESVRSMRHWRGRRVALFELEEPFPKTARRPERKKPEKETLQKVLETRLDLSTAWHPQADGQSKRMIQILEDIMRAWSALILWAEIGESSLTRLELVQETNDKVVLVKERPKVARDHQKSYVDYRRKPLKFKVGDRVLLRVSPWKGVVRFGKKGKLAPRYVGPFEILERIGLVAYRLRLPEELNSVHDTFHVSNLKKCLADANLHVPLDEIKVDKTLRFVEEPVEIMDREIKRLKRRKVALVKVRWNSKRGPEFTWEHEDQMRIKYPQLFVDRVVEPAS